MASKTDALTQAGICKVSFRVHLPEADGDATVVSATGLLEHSQEWETMRKAYYQDPQAGHSGKFLTIPKGVTVITLRLDNPPALGGL